MTVENDVTPESSPAADTTVQSVEAQATGATESKDVQADPSAAKDVSLLDSVKAALKPKTDGSSPSQAGQEAQPKADSTPESEEKDPEGDPTDEEMARLHSATRRRMKKLLTERNAANDRAAAAEDKIAELSPHAETGRRLTNFISESGMSGDEANLLLDIGRNLKKDPLKALEQMRPYFAALQQMSGEVLPNDLREAVTKGEITEAYARQLVRGRSETQVLGQRTAASEQADRERRVADQNRQHGDAVASTISQWETNQAKADPDWNLKQGRIGELIELDIRRNGYPKTTQAAVELAEKAKTQVTAEMARFQPRPKPVTPVNPASSARVAPAKPTSAVEAARMSLAAAG